MAQEQDNEILLTIKVSEEEVQKKVLGAREAIARLRKEKSALDKEYKDGVITAQEYAKSQEAIETHLEQATKELKENRKVLADYAKSTKAAEGSLEQMRTKAGLLATSIAKLSQEERESEIGQGLIKALGELKAKTLEVEKSYGTFTGQVGNYELIAGQAEQATVAFNEAIAESESSLKGIQAKIGDLTNQYDSLSQTQRENATVGGVLLAQIDKLSGELEDAKKATDEAKKSGEAYLKSLKELIATTQQEAAAFDKAGSSIDAIAENISKLESEYNGLSKAQRDSEEVGGALLKQIKSLEDQQERNRKATDRAKKSVKDYVKDIDVLGINVGRTVESFKAGGQGIATFAKGIVSTRGALVALTAVPIILVLTALVSFFTKSKEGSELLSRKLAGLTAVLDLVLGKAVSFGKAIVEAFTSPVEALKKLGELIGDNLKNRLTAINAIMTAIASRDWRKLTDAFLQLFTGITGLTGKVSDFADEANAAAAAGEKVALEAQKIADAERKLGVERAKNRAEIERLKKTSEDVTKSQEERERAAKAAYAIENGLLQQQIRLQQRKINNVKAENGLRATTKEGLDKLAEAEKELGDLKEESFGKQTELQNQLNSIQIEGAKKRAELEVATAERALEVARQKGEKNALELFDLEKDLLDKRLKLSLVGVIKGSEEEKAIMTKFRTDLTNLNIAATITEQQRQDAIRKAFLQKQLALAKAGSEEEFNARRGLLQLEYLEQVHAAEATIKDKQQLNQTLLELDTKYLRDKEVLEQEYRQAQLAKEEALLESRLTKVRRGSEKEYKLLKDQRAIALKKELDDVTKTEEQKQAIKDKYRRADEDAEKEHAIKIFDQVVEGLSGVTSTLSSFLDASVARQINALDAQQEAILSSAALSADARAKLEEQFAKKREKIEKEAAEKRRKIASIENIINTASAVTRAFVDPGGLFGAIFAGIALAKGIAQQVIIDNQKFQYGGPVFGPSHEQGGIKMIHKSGAYMGEFEGEEIILTKGVYRDPALRAKASALNVAGGGRAFAGPSYSAAKYSIPKYAGPVYNTQHATPQFRYGGTLAGFDTNAIAAAIVHGMQGVTILTDVTEVTAAQKQQKRTEVSGDVGYRKRVA